MTTSRSFTALWQRFFIIAGNIFFFIIFFLLLTTKEQDFRNTSNLKLFAGSLPITLFLYALFFFLSRKKLLLFSLRPLSQSILFLLRLWDICCCFSCSVSAYISHIFTPDGMWG